MKRIRAYYIYLQFTFILILLGSSCTKAPINGRLDGQWEVIDIIIDNATIEKEQRYFYNFSLHVCALTYYGAGALFMDGNMSYDGETLTMEFPYAESDTDMRRLSEFGILSNPVTFNVKFTDSHNLTLSNSESIVVLKKH